MEITPLGINGAWLAYSPVFSDQRGYFREWFKTVDIQKYTGRTFSVEQANISQSSKGTVRGIHYSISKRGQAKWVTCITGSIKDYVVDIRPSSSTFGKWIEIELNARSGNAVFIGENLGHAFLSLEDHTTVAYLLNTPFSPDDEFEINPFDPKIAIKWGFELSELKLSQKDKNAPMLNELLINGKLPQ